MKILLFLAIFSLTAFGMEIEALSQALYPESAQEQNYTQVFFTIVDEHLKGNDPFMGNVGPAVTSFNLGKIKFAFMKNVRDEKIDLVFFNWNLPLIEGMSQIKGLTQFYGTPVYELKGIDRKSLSTQGENDDELTNFSYVQGTHHMTAMILEQTPGYKIPEYFKNWKIHPDYMDGSHPLRQVLNKDVLVLISPDKEIFYAQGGSDPRARDHFNQMFEANGGFNLQMNSVSVHESFHIVDAVNIATGKMKKRPIQEDRKRVIRELEDERLQKLLAAYTGVIFKLGRQLGQGQTNKELLVDLNTIISELKMKYSETWKYIWNYEYTEGFAEYVAAQSVVQARFISLSQKIDLEIQDVGNNIAYRTGAIGGLYLRYDLGKLPFQNQRDHRMSVWEIALAEANVQALSNLEEVIRAHALNQEEFKSEIEAISEYLISTVRE